MVNTRIVMLASTVLVVIIMIIPSLDETRYCDRRQRILQQRGKLSIQLLQPVNAFRIKVYRKITVFLTVKGLREEDQREGAKKRSKRRKLREEVGVDFSGKKPMEERCNKVRKRASTSPLTAHVHVPVYVHEGLSLIHI